MIKDKIIVITGGSVGFGKALAAYLKQEGNTVITLSRNGDNDGETSFRCDVSDAASVADTFCRIGERYKRIDILVNNAGFGQSGAIELLDASRLKYISDTNFLGVVYCTKYALPIMNSGAKIINISSMSAFIPMPFRTMYSATKAAVNSFTLGLATELRGTGICTTALCLGDIRTDFAARRQISTDTCPRYGKRIASVDSFVSARPMSKKIAVEKAIQRVCKIISKPNPYPIYIVGGKYRLAYMLNKILPIKLLNSIVNKAMN